MIRRTLRIGVRLGLLAGIAFALFKLVQGRRSSDFGSPSPDWAPTPPQPSNLPPPTPEPELVQPVILEEVVERKAAVTAPPAPESVTPPAAKKAAPAKKAPAKKAAPAAEKAAPAKKAARTEPAAPVGKKAPPTRKAAPKKAP